MQRKIHEPSPLLLLLLCMYICMFTHIARVSVDQPGRVIAIPARGQLNREESVFLPCPRSRLIIWSGDTGSAVPSRVSLLISISG